MFGCGVVLMVVRLFLFVVSGLLLVVWWLLWRRGCCFSRFRWCCFWVCVVV